MRSQSVYGEVRFKVRQERMYYLLSDLFKKKGSGDNLTYVTKSPMSLYEVTLKCIQTPNDIKYGCASEEVTVIKQIRDFYTNSIKSILPHLAHHFLGDVEKQSWLGGVKEEDISFLASEYARSQLPLITASYAELCRGQSWSEQSAIEQALRDHHASSVVSAMHTVGGVLVSGSVESTQVNIALSTDESDSKESGDLFGLNHP